MLNIEKIKYNNEFYSLKDSAITYDGKGKRDYLLWLDYYGMEIDNNYYSNIEMLASYLGINYEISDNKMFLDSLLIKTKENRYPLLNKVQPTIFTDNIAGTTKQVIISAEYVGVHLLLDYLNGNILIENKFKTYDILLKNGQILSIKDVSKIQKDVEFYVKERMPKESLEARKHGLMDLTPEVLLNMKRDEDYLPYSMVEKNWWLFKKITNSYYKLNNQNSTLDFEKKKLITQDGDCFDFNGFIGTVEIVRKQFCVKKGLLFKKTELVTGEIEKYIIELTNDKRRVEYKEEISQNNISYLNKIMEHFAINQKI